jgi:hypothetical protein
MDPIIKLHIDLVCSYTKVPYKLICSRSRKYEIREARQILIYVLYYFAKTTKSKAAAYVNRDHATGTYSINNVANELETNRIYKAKYLPFLNGLRDRDREKEAELSGIHIFRRGDPCLFWNHINEEPISGILQEIDKAGKLAYAEDHFAPFRYWQLITSSEIVPQTIHLKRNRTVLAS